ncbi:MAG: hypothetical protein A2Z91_02165 [Deltaproteobacteria bacterium GWA2_38_16]|nr:MAG: hypothetical protein A2Z91_02165 [Deltaproteobacteria bacterium GWA2_38_16]OGQ02001.1 MAG: hypothetical protein A3D19_08460 [Deltaproteobacteria bacterium RIFCSPHIGHO2_02_FULL_38_15]OGQ61051.1 MAG: hypothetical protein A3G92_01930 [Deltaproteobacteria bacterium RIFCSPLOWO2_12_FULL_38_8]HBQ21534.1 hypothetical protein [Deltaproteobacteria bacterium]
MKPDFLDFNHYEQSVWSNPLIRFIDTILRGMAQMLFCYHPISGLLFLIGTFALSPVAGMYSLLGLMIATLTARFLKCNPYLINIGIYGYNAALLGIYWIFFDTFSISLLFLFIGMCILTVFLEHFFLVKVSSSRWGLPAISFPSLFSMWIGVSLAYLFKLVPYPISIDRLEVTTINFFANPDYELLGTYLWDHLGGIILIAMGILYNSRISFFFTAISFTLATVISLFLGGNSLPYWNDIYYNLVPMSIALGGFYFVFNKHIIFYTFLAMILTTTLFYGMHNFFHSFGFPTLIYPFNMVVFAVLCVFAKGSLSFEKFFNAYRVPLIVCKRPESILQWHQEHMESYHYWNNLNSQQNRKAAA